MKSKYGHVNFDFMPETFSLPEEASAFTHRFNQIKHRIKHAKDNDSEVQDGTPSDNSWIYKPS